VFSGKGESRTRCAFQQMVAHPFRPVQAWLGQPISSNAPVIANTDEPTRPPGMFVFRRSPRLYCKFRRNSDARVVSFHAHAFSFEVLAVELPNYPQCRVIRRHINQTVTLAHARAICNENNTAAENSRRCRKRKTEDFLQDLIANALRSLADVESVILGMISFIRSQTSRSMSQGEGNR
jgi:hypothetical protein